MTRRRIPQTDVGVVIQIHAYPGGAFLHGGSFQISVFASPCEEGASPMEYEIRHSRREIMETVGEMLKRHFGGSFPDNDDENEKIPKGVW